jgi:hypothetical protein
VGYRSSPQEYNVRMPEEFEAPETKEVVELTETLKEATEHGGSSR